jgi:opacity protein-like surface antigen
MHRRLITLIGIVILFTPSAFAQNDYKVEIVPYLGYTFSEGVDIAPLEVDGMVVDRVSPTSGFTYGFTFDFLATENFALGFNYAEQSSNLEGRAVNGGKENFADMKVRNYHALFTYNMGEEDSQMRPFFFGGLGATQYSPGEANGQSIDSSTRFSTTWGGGIKAYLSDNVGLRFTGRWTPTYIKSDPGGWWCGWYGCWVVSNPNYSHQFEMSAGVVFRF